MTARAEAVRLLDAVLIDGLMLSEIEERELSPSDLARSRRLAETVLRKLEPTDRVLAPLLRKAPPMGLRNILRLAVVEMAEGAPAHGVVNAAVSIARTGKRTQHMAGLVNAVLRAVPVESLAAQPVMKLPRWMRQPMVHAFGRDAVAGIEAVHAEAPPLDLSLRPDIAEDLRPEGEALATGSLRLSAQGQVSALPGYGEGAWWVQDAAASMAAKLLQVQPGEQVLDLCAAPGGKTMQLAAAGAEVTALDISGPRLERLRENLARTDLEAHVRVIAADALAWEPEAQFDAILLDAPCSATGTLRRHPDLPFVKDGSEIEGLAGLQAQLLDRALGWLKPGGRIVFATCSLLPAEGEDQLAAALARHPDLVVERPDLAGVEPGWWTEAGGLRLRPDLWADKGGMDGFFMVRFKKP